MNTEVNPSNAYSRHENNQSNEDEIDLLAYWHTFNKYRGTIFLLTMLIGVLTVVWVTSLEPIFRSTTLLLIESNQAKIISLENLSEAFSGRDKYYETQLEILRSRVLTEKLNDQLNLVSHPVFNIPVQKRFWHSWFSSDDGPPSAEEKRLIIVKSIQNDLEIEPVKRSQIVTISFESPDAQLAAKVPNTLAEVYIESDLEAKLEMTNKAASWLTQRMDGLRKNLRQSEKKLQQYTETQGLINVTGIKSLAVKQIEETASKLAEFSIHFSEIENIYKQVQAVKGVRSSKTFESIPAILDHPLVQGLKQAELDAERRILELRERYGQKHPKMIVARTELKATREHIAEQIQRAIERITKEYELARANVKTLQHSLVLNKNKIREINRKEYQISILDRNVEVNRQLYNLFLTRFKETNASQDIQTLQSTAGRIIEPALVNTIPYKPKKKLIVIIALLVGFLFATILAFVKEYLDNTLKNSADIEEKVGVPLLSSIPKLKVDLTVQKKIRLWDPKTPSSMSKKKSKETQFWDPKTPLWMSVTEPKSQFSESIRTARTGIMLSTIDNQHKILLITSSFPGEGKTTFSVNQAIALGQMEKTLLIEADMRRPNIGKSLGLSKKAPGLSDLVLGDQKFEDCIHHIGEKTNLDIMSCGTVPPNPLELLASSRFGELIEELTQKYGYIIIDTAPIMPVSDALALLKYANMLVYVVKANATPYQIVQDGLKRLHQAKSTIPHQIVLNQFDSTKTSRYHYYGYKGYYHNYYGDDTKAY